MTEEKGRAYLRIGEVATVLGCTTQWVSALVKNGELTSHRLADRGWHRISRESVEQYARKRHIELNWRVIGQS